MELNLKTLTRLIGIFILCIFVITSLFSSFYTLTDDYQAVVTTFGKPELVTKTGLNFKIPYIQKVEKVNTTIKGFPIGYQESEDGTTISTDNESEMISNDYNFINVDFYVSYQVTDPIKALYSSENPVMILKNVAQNAIRTVVGSYKVDAVLTTGKNEIQANIKQIIIDRMEELDIGITLNDITIQDSEPPTAEVMEAFKSVETAKQGKETAINNANKYRNEKIPSAKAEADKIIQEAEANKEAKINEAEGQVARFNDTYNEYIKYPLITKQRMFYETMEEVLPDLKIIIDSGVGSSTQKILPLDDFSTNTIQEVGGTQNAEN